MQKGERNGEPKLKSGWNIALLLALGVLYTDCVPQPQMSLDTPVASEDISVVYTLEENGWSEADFASRAGKEPTPDPVSTTATTHLALLFRLTSGCM